MAVGFAVAAAIFLYRSTSIRTSDSLAAVFWLVAAVIWWRDKEYGHRYASLLVAIAFTKGAFV